MQTRAVLLIAAGGTIDKEYPTGKGVREFAFGTSPASVAILRRAGASIQRLVGLPPKDSLDMDDDDRARIAALCSSAPEEAVVITHGTDTMIETAQILERLAPSKYIVLTGAGQPASTKDTDADFNLGFAVCAAQLAGRRGAYIAMNGRLFSAADCRKRDDGVFDVRERERDAELA